MAKWITKTYFLSSLSACQHRETIQRILTNGEVWSGGRWAKEKGEPKIRGKKDERNALKTHVPVLNKFWEADRICQVNFHGVFSEVKSHTHFCISLVIIDILRYILKVILIQFNLLNCTLSITLDTLYIIHYIYAFICFDKHLFLHYHCLIPTVITVVLYLYHIFFLIKICQIRV